VQGRAHDGLDDDPVEDDDQLIGQALGVLGPAALGLAGEVNISSLVGPGQLARR